MLSKRAERDEEYEDAVEWYEKVLMLDVDVDGKPPARYVHGNKNTEDEDVDLSTSTVSIL